MSDFTIRITETTPPGGIALGDDATTDPSGSADFELIGSLATGDRIFWLAEFDEWEVDLNTPDPAAPPFIAGPGQGGAANSTNTAPSPDEDLSSSVSPVFSPDDRIYKVIVFDKGTARSASIRVRGKLF